MSSANQTIEFNKLFGLFLRSEGVVSKFKKTEYGYATYKGDYKLFSKKMKITHSKNIKVFNGCDNDEALEISTFIIKKLPKMVNVYFESTIVI